MKKFSAFMLILFSIFIGVMQTNADDTDLFITDVPPDGLIALDLSSSMNFPAISTFYVPDDGHGDCVNMTPQTVCANVNCRATSTKGFYLTSGTGHTAKCVVTDNGGFPGETPLTHWYSNTTCDGDFVTGGGKGKSGNPTGTTLCSKIDIAKRAIATLLDHNNDGKWDCKDESAPTSGGLGIRLGYERFINTCLNQTTGNYYQCVFGVPYGPYSATVASEIRVPLPDNTYACQSSNSKYHAIYTDVNGITQAYGRTPDVDLLDVAKNTLDANKANDNAKDCRKKFVILITDGDDTLACNGTGQSLQDDQYKRRRATVAKTKALKDAGYKVYVVGFGKMTHWQMNTLEWAAYYGGTDNPFIDNSVLATKYDPSLYTDPCTAISTIVDCTRLGDRTHKKASSNDPGESDLTGYAFFASNPADLVDAMNVISRYIVEESYSFTAPTVPSIRMIDKDVVYISSFIPTVEDPIYHWQGNLKAFRLDQNGLLPVDKDGNPLVANLIWDAYENLKTRDPNSRTIKTVTSGTLKDFNTTSVLPGDLGLGTDTTARDVLVNYIRGFDSYGLQNGDTTIIRESKLGDIFHSNAVIVGSPSASFEDQGFSGSGGFYNNNKNRTKVIIVGSNDGMLHAFDASNGNEKWAFIPNSLLTSLKLNVTGTPPGTPKSGLHYYYVDGSPKVSDVWFYSSDTDTTKASDEWKTVLVCGLRKGGNTYFALDITDTLNPKFLWEFPKSADSATLALVGQSWSEPGIGRVKREVSGGLYERWVAFIGGGFDPNDTAPDKEATAGKVFFVVDIMTGEIIKQFYGLPGMTHAFAASPTAVDTNADGYVDKVYIADLAGQMWVFDVSFDAASNKSDSLWTGQILFQSPAGTAEKHTVYSQAAVSFDNSGTPWAFFGTGDKENPKDPNSHERFYAVRDDQIGPYPYSESNLSDVTDVKTHPTFSQIKTNKGWFIKLNMGEKVLAKSSVFNRVVYFTSYTPGTISTSPCIVGGDATLYAAEFLSGGGALDVTDMAQLTVTGNTTARSRVIGQGVPSAPIISINQSGQATLIIGTTNAQVFSQKAFSPTALKTMIYWREVVQ